MNAVRLWILWSVFCSGAGWLLSSLGQLNRLGYTLLALAAIGAFWIWRRSLLSMNPVRDDVRSLTLGDSHPRSPSAIHSFASIPLPVSPAAGSALTPTLRSILHRALHRFRNPLPLAFGLLALLVLAGGLLHEPNNGDTMGYRLPRVLHWLAEGHWHWIHCDDPRLNVTAPGWEWQAAPILLFLKSDRPLFLINWLPFVLLPGLTFSLLWRLGVSRRAAWHWMWILPSGYCFVMQAGSVCNDSFTATYALAAMVLALRSSRAIASADLGYSLLAAALLTGAKQTNLPLLLPWAIAFAPGLWRLLNVWMLGRLDPPLTSPSAQQGERAGERGHQLREAGLGADSLSLRERVRVRGKQPSADSSGPDSFPPNRSKTVPPAWPSFTHLLLATAAVCLLAAAVSLLPNILFNLIHTGVWTGFDRLPFRPDSPGWGVAANLFVLPLQNMVPPIFPWADAWNHLMQNFLAMPLGTHFRSFESFGTVARAAHELSAGLGPGVCLLALLSFLGSGRMAWSWRTSRFWLCCTPWLAALVLMSQMPLWQVGRYFSAYYPLMLPLLFLGSGHERLVRRRWWRLLALLVVVTVIPLVVLSRSRPLWPVESVLTRLEKTFPNSTAVRKAHLTFAFSAGFNRTLQPLLDLLPAGEKTIGYAAAATSRETSLWRPFGQRRVERVNQADPPESLAARGLRFVFVELDAPEPSAIPNWCQRYHARIIGQASYRTAPEAPEQNVYLADLLP